ncbi:LysR family transcriptional regulator [Marinifilum breve]|uniref:LysR family transcriptional regulator n=1 Tax=Marinifilum breve TaxID=2184082 RepID=A0A2V3ZTK9_9BACT|nr:LysR family transcriptional regulator [Marinifilum breve]PXX98078.1 LysR family transcriptional regulator [Marinifilum breve]
MVNFEWFRTFKTIYEEGTLTSTANKLYISQSGVSLHLSSLEAYVGGKLFDRVSKKMIPTEKGKLLYNTLLGPVNELLDIEKQFQRSQKTDTPTLTIGMCFETFQIVLEKHIHKLKFNLINRFSGYQQLLNELEKGINDVVVTPQKADLKGIEYIPIMKENIVLVGSNDIDKDNLKTAISSKNKSQLLEFLLEQTWYGASSDNEHFIRFWNTNFGNNPNFRQNYIVPNFISIVNSLKYGKGVAVVPDFLGKDAIENKEIQLLWKGHKRISNQLYFAFRKNSIYKEQINTIQEIFMKEMN